MNVTDEWACSAPAGEELDRICAKWLGIPGEYSTEWAAAGPLLEAMDGQLEPPMRSGMDTWLCYVWHTHHGERAPTPQLAIARVCATLVARGITKEDME